MEVPGDLLVFVLEQAVQHGSLPPACLTPLLSPQRCCGKAEAGLSLWPELREQGARSFCWECLRKHDLSQAHGSVKQPEGSGWSRATQSI